MRSFASASLVLLALAATLPAQTGDDFNTGFGVVGGLAIPPTGTGSSPQSAANTTVQTINSPWSRPGLIQSIRVGVTLTHTFVGDLHIALEHCGVVCMLSDGTGFSYPQSSDLDGVYIFSDLAGTDFDDATVTGGVVNPGFHRPDQPLDAAFAGLPYAGDWKLTIWDDASGDTGTLNGFVIAGFIQGARDIDNGVSLAVPSTGSSGTTTHVFTITETGRVGEVGLDLNWNHTYAADLDFTLSHNGITITGFDGDTSGLGNADFDGVYFFRETLGGAISNATVTNGDINPGVYLWDNAMTAFHGTEMAGDWVLTITDDAGGDTGTLIDARLTINEQAFTVDVVQPNGPADVTVNFTNGARTGDRYFKPYTLNPGAFPNGWFYGLDIDFLSLVTLWGLPPGVPTITGTLGACASDSGTLAGPIPSNIAFQMVTLEFNQLNNGFNQTPYGLAQISNTLEYVTQ